MYVSLYHLSIYHLYIYVSVYHLSINHLSPITNYLSIIYLLTYLSTFNPSHFPISV